MSADDRRLLLHLVESAYQQVLKGEGSLSAGWMLSARNYLEAHRDTLSFPLPERRPNNQVKDRPGVLVTALVSKEPIGWTRCAECRKFIDSNEAWCRVCGALSLAYKVV